MVSVFISLLFSQVTCIFVFVFCVSDSSSWLLKLMTAELLLALSENGCVAAILDVVVVVVVVIFSLTAELLLLLLLNTDTCCNFLLIF